MQGPCIPGLWRLAVNLFDTNTRLLGTEERRSTISTISTIPEDARQPQRHVAPQAVSDLLQREADANARPKEASNPTRMTTGASDPYLKYDSIVEAALKVVEALREDSVPLNPAAVGYIFFAARREGSEQGAQVALGIFLSLEPHLRSKQVLALPFFLLHPPSCHRVCASRRATEGL